VYVYRGYQGSKGWDKNNEKILPFFYCPEPVQAGWAIQKNAFVLFLNLQ
jgi:hypothetical protein